MRAFVLGCSHAAGSEIWHQPGFLIQDVEQREAYGYTHSFAAKLAQAMGYDVYNHAIPGGSNDAMYRIFCELDPEQHDIVIACWTGPDRTELWYEPQQRWIPVCGGSAITNNKKSHPVALQGMVMGDYIPGQQDFQTYAHWWTVYETNQWRGPLNRSKNIEALNYRAAANNISVINIASFGTTHQAPGFWPVTFSFYEWASTHQYAQSQGGHFFENAHQDFAQKVLDAIDLQGCFNYNKSVRD